MKRFGACVTLSCALGLSLVVSLLWLLHVPRDAAQAQPGASVIRVATTGSDAPGCGGEASPCRTVQYAVDQAASGDEIRVAAGIYSEVRGRPSDDFIVGGVLSQVVYLTKTTTLGGGYTTANWTTPDPNANPTILDGQGKGRGVYIAGDISPTLQGFQVIHGDAAGMGGDFGSGIYVSGAAAYIKNNQVLNNVAFRGGGIFLQGSAATLERNTIAHNFGTNSGGGLYLDSSAATLVENTVFSNTSYCGGLSLVSSAATLHKNIIINNQGISGGAGGLCIYDSAATLVKNTIFGNTSEGQGGGLRLMGSSTLIGNAIVNNKAVGPYGRGGGLILSESKDNLINNIIADNQTSGNGSGVYIESSSPRLSHNTIVHNTGGEGSGVFVTGFGSISSTAALFNTILVSHTVGISITGGNTVTVQGVLWYGTPITTSQEATATLVVQDQYSGDPAFLNPEHGDYHIGSLSAAIDRGVNASIYNDFDGLSRPLGNGFDLGAYEYAVIHLYLPILYKN